MLWAREKTKGKIARQTHPKPNSPSPSSFEERKCSSLFFPRTQLCLRLLFLMTKIAPQNEERRRRGRLEECEISSSLTSGGHFLAYPLAAFR